MSAQLGKRDGQVRKTSVYLHKSTTALLGILRQETGKSNWILIGEAVAEYAKQCLVDPADVMPASSRRAIAQKPASGSEREFWQNK